jgi:hypothetical protein
MCTDHKKKLTMMKNVRLNPKDDKCEACCYLMTVGNIQYHNHNHINPNYFNSSPKFVSSM